MQVINIGKTSTLPEVATYLEQSGFIPVSDQILFKFNTGWDPSASCVIDHPLRFGKTSLYYTKEIAYSVFYKFRLTILVSEDSHGVAPFNARNFHIKLDMQTDDEHVTIFYKHNIFSSIEELEFEIKTAMELTGADDA